jgi:hypothetical protein
LAAGVDGLSRDLNKYQLDARFANYKTPRRSNTMDSTSDMSTHPTPMTNGVAHEDDASQPASLKEVFSPQPGYTAWVSQAGYEIGP